MSKFNKIDKLILTAGPSITYLEIDYVLDAVKNGWNNNHSAYIKKFEKAVSDYIGVKYALATSSCTGALHLALLAMGVGPGDEVIVPDISWIATASVVAYTGATPIFCDVNRNTWVMDVSLLESLITEKTKVVIPVHLYGNPVDMIALQNLKEKYGFYVLEDAAPSFGTIFDGRKTGSFGDAAAFSFQGAKALVTGEGGIFLTNSEKLYKKFKVLWDHGRDADNPRIDQINTLGYKYKMSNIQAALGLAQVERVEEIVKRKREIFELYRSRLSLVPGIELNPIIDNSRQLFWMTSVVLSNEINVSRDEFMSTLKSYNIDSRPFFPPMSNYGIFGNNRYFNTNAEIVGYRGVNLPSGHELSNEEVLYIAESVRKIVLSYQNINYNPDLDLKGWIITRNEIYSSLRTIKNDLNYRLQFDFEDEISFLQPINTARCTDEDIELLMKWRNGAQEYFPTQSNITFEGTKIWLKNAVDLIDDRILFWVINGAGIKIGHVGLYRFDFRKQHCELDNIIRGESTSKGIMTVALRRLLDFVQNDLFFSTVYLRVFSDNHRAIKLYNSIGFNEIQRRPLKEIVDKDSTRYIELNDDVYSEVKRYFTTMKYVHSGEEAHVGN